MTDRGPPADARRFRLSARHFAAADVFLVAGAGTLVWRASALAGGAFWDRGVVAAAHLLTLGWISTALLGALYEFLPARLGVSVRWRGLAEGTFALWTAGVVAFALGVGTGRPAVHLPAAGALGLAAVLFAVNVADALRRAARRGLGWWCVVGGTVSLVGAWVLGGLLAANLSNGVLGSSRLTVLLVHLHVAGGGWVLLTTIGMADRLLPTSRQSHGTGGLPGKAAAALVGAGTAGLLLSGHLLPVRVLGPALALQAAGAAAFLVQVRRHYGRRRRSRLDPGMRLVAGALLSLAAAVAVGSAALLVASPGGRLLTAYGVLLVPGGLGPLVAELRYRVLPSSARPGRSLRGTAERDGRGVAGRDDRWTAGLFDHRTADAGGALLFGGVALLALGVAVGETGLCRAGALGFTAGGLIQAVQVLRITRRRS